MIPLCMPVIIFWEVYYDTAVYACNNFLGGIL